MSQFGSSQVRISQDDGTDTGFKYAIGEMVTMNYGGTHYACRITGRGSTVVGSGGVVQQPKGEGFWDDFYHGVILVGKHKERAISYVKAQHVRPLTAMEMAGVLAESSS